jgi:hypothetical protein
MSDGLGVQAPAKNAVANDPHQGGNKSAERGGANKGIVDHHEVDKIDHAKHASKAKEAMGAMGHYNCTYYDGGQR